MAVEQPTELALESGRDRWIAGVVASLLGTIVFGLLAMVMMPDMMGMIGELYGFGGNEAVGWIAHLFHGAIFGLLYVGITSLARLRTYARRVSQGAGLGIVYGVVIWIVGASIIMPAWLGMPEAIPDFNTTSLIGHAVWGVILGAVYPLLLGWME